MSHGVYYDWTDAELADRARVLAALEQIADCLALNTLAKFAAPTVGSDEGMQRLSQRILDRAKP